jgi:tetrahydromethanopterin S-methyltransferase subunit E
MTARGIKFGLVICIPFWLIAILFISTGAVSGKTLIFIGLVLLALLLLVILASSLIPKRNKQDKQIIIED